MGSLTFVGSQWYKKLLAESFEVPKTVTVLAGGNQLSLQKTARPCWIHHICSIQIEIFSSYYRHLNGSWSWDSKYLSIGFVQIQHPVSSLMLRKLSDCQLPFETLLEKKLQKLQKETYIWATDRWYDLGVRFEPQSALITSCRSNQGQLLLSAVGPQKNVLCAFVVVVLYSIVKYCGSGSIHNL